MPYEVLEPESSAPGYDVLEPEGAGYDVLEPEPTSNKVADFLKRIPEGMATGVGRRVRGAATALDILNNSPTGGGGGDPQQLEDAENQYVEFARQRVAGAFRHVPPAQLDAAEQRFQSTIRRLQGQQGQAVEAADGRQQRLAESTLYQMGRQMEDDAREFYNTDRARDPEFVAQLGSGLGDFAVDLTTGGAVGSAARAAGAGKAVAGALAPGVAGLQYGASAAQSGYDEAVEAGRPDNATLAYMANAGLGATTEALLGIPGRIIKMADRFRKMGIAPDRFRQALLTGAEGAVREGAQESLEQIGGNITAQELYDPERGTFEGVPRAAALGAVLGGGIGGLAGAATPPRYEEPGQRVRIPPATGSVGAQAGTQGQTPVGTTPPAPAAPAAGQPTGDILSDVEAELQANAPGTAGVVGGLKQKINAQKPVEERAVEAIGNLSDQLKELQSALVQNQIVKPSGTEAPAKALEPQAPVAQGGTGVNVSPIIPAADADEIVAPAPQLPPAGTGESKSLREMLGAKSDEMRGQAILDALENEGKSPKDVADEFWTETYPNLAPQVQERFHRMLEQVIGGKPEAGRTWQSEWGAPTEHRLLEGEERGLIALMEVGNRNRNPSRKAIPPPSEPSAELRKTNAPQPPPTGSNAVAGEARQPGTAETRRRGEAEEIKDAIAESNWRGSVRTAVAPSSWANAGQTLYIPVDASGKDVVAPVAGGGPILAASPREAIERAMAIPRRAPANPAPQAEQPQGEPTGVPWDQAKAGDIVGNKTVGFKRLVKRRIRTRKEAQALAEQVGGGLSLDGPRAWAVLQPVSTPSTPAQANQSGDVNEMVEPTIERGAEPSTDTPAEQRKPVEPMQARAQKKFLLTEIDKAIAEAPDGYDFDSTSMAPVLETALKLKEMSDVRLGQLLSTENELGAEVRRAAELTGLDTLKEKGEVVWEMDASTYYIGTKLDELATAKAYDEMPRVTIAVPDDGVFTIINNREALRQFKERAAKFPTALPKYKVPGTARFEPTAPRVLGKLTDETAEKAAALFASTQDDRAILNSVWSDGKQTVATNGRALIVVKKGIGGTKANPLVKMLRGVKRGESNYPNWTQVVPNETPLHQAKNLDVTRLHSVLTQATEATTERNPSIRFVLYKDGTYGVQAFNDEAEYQHNIRSGEIGNVTSLNPEYLLKTLDAARMLGDDKVTIGFSDELSPILVEGKAFKVVVMPMRMNAAPSGASTVAEATAAVLRFLGVSALPSRVRVVNEPDAPYGGYFENGEVVINAPKAGDPVAVLLEEGLHGVWQDPQLQAAWQAVLDEVTPADIDAERARREGMDTRAEVLREEAAIAKVLSSQPSAISYQRGAVARFWRALRDAFRRLLGINVPVDARGELLKAARAFLLTRNDSLPGKRVVAGNAILTAPGMQVYRNAVTAHHGTPHKVGRFTTAKIGTGEGAQVYGWGLYFAENEKVAQGYQETLSSDAVRADEFLHSPEVFERMTADERRMLANASREEIVALAKNKGLTGNTYTVRLNVRADQLLDWDKPLSEQSERVRGALAALGKRYGAVSRATVYLQKPDAYEGSALYDAAKHDVELFDLKLPENWREIPDAELRRLSDAAPAASRLLASLGIRGIRYLDQGSRGRTRWVVRSPQGGEVDFPNEQMARAYLARNPGETLIAPEQTYNYVIFDENDIEITHENGQPVSFNEASGAGQQQGERRFAVGEKPKLFQEAIEYFGTTRDITEAGYVLPDGTMLDFSGRNQMQDSYERVGTEWRAKAGRDWQRGQRNEDHREVVHLDSMPDGTEPTAAMIAFQQAGAMRVDPNGSIDLEAEPSAAQISAIQRLSDLNDETLYVDVADGARRASFEGNARKVIGLIRRFYRGENFEGLERRYAAPTPRPLSKGWAKSKLRKAVADFTRNDPVEVWKGRKGIMPKTLTDIADWGLAYQRGIEASFRTRIRDMEAEFRREHGKDNEPKREALRAYLEGDGQLADVGGLALQEKAKAFREYVDRVSQMVIDAGMLSPQMAETWTENMGTWLKRTYLAFDKESDWNYDELQRLKNRGDKEIARIWNAAETFLRRENPDATDAEIEAMMRALVDREQVTAALQPGAGSNPKVNISSLIRRKDIPKVLREWMGEIKDPFAKSYQSSKWVAQFLARNLTQRRMAKVGLELGLFSDKQEGRNTVELYPTESNLVPMRDPETGETMTDDDGNPIGQYASRVDRRMEPLHGLFASPDMAAAIEKYVSSNYGQIAEVSSALARGYFKFVGWVKQAKVGLNPYSYPTNAGGGLVMRLAAGAINPLTYKRAWQAVRQGDDPITSEYDPEETSRRMANRLTYLMAARAGVTGGGILNQDVQNALQREDAESSGNFVADVAGDARRAYDSIRKVLDDPKGKRGYKDLMRALGDMASRPGQFGIGAVDNVFRVSAFLDELDLANRAFGNTKTQAEKIEWAADRAQNIYQTYDRVPEGLRALSRIGVLGTFVTFKLELARNTYWIARYAKEGLASDNPALRADGVKKAAGLLSVIVAPIGIAAASQALAGIDDDEEEAFREALPPWDRNEVILWLNRDGTRVKYSSMSYLLPHVEAFKVARAAFRGELFESVAEDFFGPGAALGPLVEAAANVRLGRPGSTVTEREGVEGAMERLGYAAGQTLPPAIINPPLDLWRAFTRPDDGTGAIKTPEDVGLKLLGVRSRTVDAKQAPYYKFRELAARWRSASSEASYAKKRYSTVDKEKVLEAQEYADRKHEELRREYQEAAESYKTLGLTAGDLYRAKRNIPGFPSQLDDPVR